jgi:chromate reductase
MAGSLRRDSYNLLLLRAAADEVPPGATLNTWPRLQRIPPYDEDLDLPVAPEPVAELRAALAKADALLVSTPEYNASIPGQLKNALDWASRPFPDNVLRAKPVAVIGASTSLFGAVWAQAELRKVLAATGASVIDEELPVGLAHEAFDADGKLCEPQLRTQLAQIVRALVNQVSNAHATAAAELAGNQP